MDQPKGYMLIVLIFLMTILSIIGLHTFSMFSAVTIDQADNAKQNQAFGIAQSGANWILLYYTQSEDWITSSSALDNTAITINNSNIDINITNSTDKNTHLIITANINASSHILARTVELDLSQINVTGTIQERGLTSSWNAD